MGLQHQNHATTAHAPVQRKAVFLSSLSTRGTAQVQRQQLDQGGQSPGEVQEIANQGIQGGGHALPFGGQIQESFGKHDISGVRAHTGSGARQAAASMGAAAYATGNDVAFGESGMNLHTAAHEAAHVVQQRQGVQLSGGVGQAGDPYEQHADQVADKVVAGESAEELLSHGPGGGGGGGVQHKAVQKEDKPKGHDQALEDKLDTIAGNYSFICFKQRDAVADLNTDVQKEDPPPLWQSLLLSLGEVALTVALGGIGGYVAARVGAALKDKASEVLAKVVADAMKDGAKNVVKQTFKGTTKLVMSSSKDPREIFFRGQRDTLTDTAQRQASQFNSQQRQKIRDAADPHKVADGLVKATQESYTRAYELQRNNTLDQWAIYKAQQSLGVSKDDKGKKQGTDLGSQLGDTSAVGVVGIVVRVKQPGDRPEILRAEIEGLNEGLRNVIESRPISSLTMPVTVHGEVGEDIGWAAKYIQHRSQPTIKFGRNEKGVVWVPNYSSGNTWLYLRAHPHPELWGPKGRPADKTQAGAFEGARLLLQDMGNMTLKGKLSG